MPLRQRRTSGFPPAPWTWGAVPFTEGKDYLIDAETGCWNWQCYVDPKGYGKCQRVEFKAATATSFAHRQCWMAVNGPVERGVDIHHVCENTRCINPDHLEAKPKVTHLEDHRHAASPLDAADVEAIRWAAWDNEPLSVLADWYGMKVESIFHIVEGINWKSAPGPIGKPPCPGCMKPLHTRKASLCRECKAEKVAA